MTTSLDQTLSPSLQKLNRDIALFPHITPITPDMNITRKGVSKTVMLDRYAYKDVMRTTLGVSDLVVVTYKEDPKFPKRGFGHVMSMDDENVTVLLDQQFEDGLIITVPISKVDKPLEIFYEQIARRVAQGLASVENVMVRPKVEEEFYQELVQGNIVPAGRVLMGAGSGQGVTYFNCYVMPHIHDSRGGIGDHRKKTMEIMSRGGGVGTNGSTLRPRAAIVHGVNGRSSGSVTWLNDLAGLTNLVEQGGSRRGAQMIMLNDWHPDIVEFIISKMQNPAILRKILATTKSSLIKEEVNRKLKFTPFKDMEQALIEHVVRDLEEAKGVMVYRTPEEDAALLAYSKQQLKDGGTWSVHNPEFLTGANISVNITSDFMDAVENDELYSLRFPDLDSYDQEMRDIYDDEWQDCGDVREWEAQGYGVKTYHRIPAKDLWELINMCATYSAEPGIFFIDNANDMTNASSYGMKVVATNPCGEQPLAPYSVCNLAAINLANMSINGKVDYQKLINTVRVQTRMQDNVIDATPYFLDENTKQALGERRVGMGVMGLHDLLIRTEKVYGSPEGNDTVDKVFETIAVNAYGTSIELAKEKGSFPFLDVLPNGQENTHGREKFINSGYMQKMPENIRQDILKYGIRNSHLLTVAPTGSTGTMMNVATGLEPYYSFMYFRSGRLGKFIPVIADIAVEWLERNRYEVTDDNIDELIAHLPEEFIGTMDLTPEAHVEVQCIIQRWVDSSISKTVNAPRGYTVAQVQEVYQSLHRGGAKGGTVYVDGSRDSQVLSLTTEENEFSDAEEDTNEGIAVITAVANTVVSANTGKKIGTDVGDTCALCEAGTIFEAGGCHTCNNCGFQSQCGL